MSTTIRRWGLVVPRWHWARRRRAPLEGMTLEEQAGVIPRWGSVEVRSHKAEPHWQGAFTRDEMLLMERMGRIR